MVKLVGWCVLAAVPWLASGAQAQIYNDIKSELRLQWLQMKRQMPRHPNPDVQRLTECIAWAIIDQIPEEYQELDWEVIVFDNSARNASVTPEGKIAVFSGILEVANTPDKLAGVIGHEVAHLTEGHVRERALAAAGSGLAGALGSALGGFGNEARRGAEVVVQLPFQRDQESEADLVGMEYMARAGYNPATVLDIWRAMSEGRGRQSDWLSTHPEPSLRMTDIAGNLTPMLIAYNEALDAGVRPGCSL